MDNSDTHQKKNICIIVLTLYANIDKVEIFHILCDKVALVTLRRSEWETRSRDQIVFRKVWTIHIENVDKR